MILASQSVDIIQRIDKENRIYLVLIVHKIFNDVMRLIYEVHLSDVQ